MGNGTNVYERKDIIMSDKNFTEDLTFPLTCMISGVNGLGHVLKGG